MVKHHTLTLCDFQIKVDYIFVCEIYILCISGLQSMVSNKKRFTSEYKEDTTDQKKGMKPGRNYSNTHDFLKQSDGTDWVTEVLSHFQQKCQLYGGGNFSFSKTKPLV